MTLWLLNMLLVTSKYHGRTKSFLCANVQSCIERFGITMDALLGNSCVGQSRQTIDNIGNSRFISEYYMI